MKRMVATEFVGLLDRDIFGRMAANWMIGGAGAAFLGAPSLSGSATMATGGTTPGASNSPIRGSKSTGPSIKTAAGRMARSASRRCNAQAGE